MLYSAKDRAVLRGQLFRRLSLDALIFLVPFAIGLALMYTCRIEWLSMLLSMLGMVTAVFYYGMCVSPFLSYDRFLREIAAGRSRSFTGAFLCEESASVRDGVACRTLYFADKDASDEERDFAGVFATFPRISWKGHCMYCGHCAPCPKGIRPGRGEV